MADNHDINGWSPRYKDLSELDSSRDAYDLDSTLEELLTNIELYERIIDDFKAFRQANKPVGVVGIHSHLTPREGF